MLVADPEVSLKTGKWGRVKIEEKRIYSMAYADDIILISEDEEGMKSMMARLERYLEEKCLKLNSEKTKVMRFRKGGGKRKKTNWWWKGRKIEKIKEFKYLGYNLQRNGGQEANIRERRGNNGPNMGNRKKKIWE